ncbi:unnamed protein product [Gemmataceae bacterium]|jgi:hypothetical protein|nr:unnamed protein product [Gemmataceae bacterium]VTT97348.1 unnamed protein product [Gemmataceae bacterium]
MFISDPTVLMHETESPAIDATEARWAAEYLSLILNQLDPSSPVTMVLTQARRELTSLAQSGTEAPRLRIAA